MMNKFLHTIEVRLVSIILVLVSVVRIRIVPISHTHVGL